MSPIMLILTAGLVLHVVSTQPGDAPLVAPGILIFIVIMPKLFLAASFTALARRFKQLFEETGTGRSLEALAAAHRIYRAGVAGLFILDLVCGLLLVMQQAAGVPLLDELFVVAIPLLMLAWGRWCTTPIDQRAAIAFADRFGLVGDWRPRVRGRLQYVLHRMAEDVVPVLVPALLVIGWWDLIEHFAPPGTARWTGESANDGPMAQSPSDTLLKDVLHMLGPAIILIVWPWVLRFAWDMKPLPDGKLRTSAMALLTRARCSLTQLLYWKTGGRMAFAAVLGGLPGARFLILSDGLVCRMTNAQLQAVIAHEAAHLKKKHFLKMIVCAAGLISSILMLTQAALQPMLRVIGGDELATSQPVLFMAMGLAWYVAFGWLSRRFERQADVFAAVQLSAERTVSDTKFGADIVSPAGSASAEHPDLANRDRQVENGPGAGESDDCDGRASRQTRTYNARPEGSAASVTLSCDDDASSPNNEAITITHEGVEAMNDALSAIAAINSVDVTRKAWRHGSIEWRQLYVRTLVGQRADKLFIDRLLGALWIASLIAVAAAVIVYNVLGYDMPV